MINTKIFTYSGSDNGVCFEKVLKDVNNLIFSKNIKKEDILEYHTRNWHTEGIGRWHVEATISWWENNI